MSAVWRTSVLVVLLGAVQTVFFATLIFWLAGSGDKLASGGSGSIIALGRLSGLLLMLCVYAQLLLASRMPPLYWTERLQAWKLHRTLGFTAVFAGVAHVPLLVLGYAVRDEVSVVTQFVTFLTSWEGVFYAFLALCVILCIGFFSWRRIKSHLRYETWYAIHLFIYGALAFAFIHQLASGDMADGWARTFWLTTSLTVVVVFLLFRVVRPAWYFLYHRFTVSRVVAETPTTTSIYITGYRIQRFRFDPGQYAHFTFLQKGMTTHHPFSFSQPPGSHELRITVKNFGDFTGQIASLRPGTRVVIDGPMGTLTTPMALTTRYCFIAGGVGVTPIATMVRSLPNARDAVVYLANRTSLDEPLLQEITATEAAVFRYLSEEGERKIITQEEIARTCPDIATRDVFLCGPPGMMRALTSSLAALGVPSHRMHTEVFAY